MNAENRIDEILQELRKPFHPSQITWKPGSVTEDGTKALALAYADLRAYQNRLDEVCGMDWSVSYTPWGERIVCHLTIQGITRSSTGEPDMQAERSEIAGTAAEAQAFKRACSMFGLGRYLYNLPMVWADYDAENNRFTEQAKKRLVHIVTEHYQRSLRGEEEADETASEIAAATPDPQPQNGHEPSKRRPKRHRNGVAPKDAPVDENATQLHTDFDTLGQALYGEQWDRVRTYNVQRISGGKAQHSSELTPEQIQKLIRGMEKLKRQREVTT